MANWFDNLFQSPVQALNNVRSNVWAVLLIGAGLILITHGHPTEGGSLITGAFAILRGSPEKEPDKPKDN